MTLIGEIGHRLLGAYGNAWDHPRNQQERRWLRDQRWVFEIGGDGKPKVVTAYAERRLGAVDSAPPPSGTKTETRRPVMSRPRRHDKHLPPCVYPKHGADYWVKGGKWHRLGATLGEALRAYARLIAPAAGTVSALLDRTLIAAAARVTPSTLGQYETVSRNIRRNHA